MYDRRQWNWALGQARALHNRTNPVPPRAVQPGDPADLIAAYLRACHHASLLWQLLKNTSHAGDIEAITPCLNEAGQAVLHVHTRTRNSRGTHRHTWLISGLDPPTEYR